MKFKFTQNELKKQRDALHQYERFLPTLQLKKQQLQLEIIHQQEMLRQKTEALLEREASAGTWAGLLCEFPKIREWLVPFPLVMSKKNIAGVDIPLFARMDFPPAVYDLFTVPFFVDEALVRLREIVSLRGEIRVMETGIATLRQELRITTQRVNLFEKVKIPETREAVRLIKIALGDQMTNAVGRSKMAKNRIEQEQGPGVPV